MDCTKKDVENAILIIAHRLNESKGKEIYSYLINSSVLPKVVELIAYDLFTNNYQQHFETNNNVSEAINLVRNYALELQVKGFVEFKEI